MESCNIVGSIRAPAQVKIYAEDSQGGKDGPPVWTGIIQQGQSIPISTQNGRIRYDYRYDDNDQWKEDIGAWCHNDDNVDIP